MKRNFFLICTLAFFFPLCLFSQGSLLSPGNPTSYTIDRLSIKSGIPAQIHTANRYFSRKAATRYAMLLDTANWKMTVRDQEDLEYIFLDNNEWLGEPIDVLPLAVRRWDKSIPTQVQAALKDHRYTKSKKSFLSYFFPTPANFIEVNQRDFYIRFNPLLQVKYGSRQDATDPYFLNQRGFSIRGGVDDRIYFDFQLIESQAALPTYVQQFVDRFDALPGNGLYKPYTSDVFNIKQGTDFLNSQGYLGFNFTPHVGLQFGYGRNFIGNGYRSLLLSDFANNYLYLKLNWKIWRFQYQNIFAELGAGPAGQANFGQPLPKKYMAAHHLSIDILPNLNVGIFETVIFNRQDHFEFQYLNPIILYRTIEQSIGSPDNVLLGLHGSWNVKQKVQFYGQLMLDEFVFKELFVEKRGWWANKWGLQAGGKYIDAFGIDHLDLQGELNIVRPYTYAHTDGTSSYTHVNQSLAHPLGANFREIILRARYAPTAKLLFDGKVFLIEQGENTTAENYGESLIEPNSTRLNTYGNTLLQGVKGDIQLISLDASYQLKHNLFVDAFILLREKDSADDARDLSSQIFGLGLRWNVNGGGEWRF